MSSQKFRKYLAYYQKTIQDEPENIEARLRLASLFKEMGQRSRAIDEYVTASKLLAEQGLPLEAIAACKAVLELDPGHTEVQFFLARLFAQAPEVSGAARVARPVEDPLAPRRRIELEPPKAPEPSSRVVTEALSTDEMEAFQASGARAITLARPKTHELEPIEDILAEPEVSDSLIIDNPLTADPDASTEDLGDLVELGPPTGEFTRTYDTRDRDVLRHALEVMTRGEVEAPAPLSAPQGARETIELGDEDIEQSELRSTVAMSEEEAERHRALALEERTRTGTARWPGYDRSVDRMIGEDIMTRSTVVADAPLEPPPVHQEDDGEDLPEIALFSRLNQRAFVELLERVTLVEVSAGDTLIDLDRPDRILYIIVSGKARAYKAVAGMEVELGEFIEGDFFGEFALLTGRNSLATVRALTDVVALGIAEQDVHEVAQLDPEIWDTLWDYYHTRMLNNLMVSDTIFGTLTREARDSLIDLFELRELVQGDVLVDAGSPCPCVTLVLFGELSIAPARGDEPRAVREGEFFGFVASLSDEACGATVSATVDATLLCLPARAFRQITRANAGIATEIRRLLRTRHQRPDLFLTGITRYAETGVE